MPRKRKEDESMNIDRALSDVHDDLRRAGFLTDPIYDVDTYLVYLGLFGEALGYYWRGNIYIVRNTIPDLFRLCFGGQRQWRSFRGVIRHEFGHAIMDRHHSDIRWGDFRSCFGRVRCGRDGCDCVVTEYAGTNREEDFCETLEFFLTKRSRFKPSCPVIKEKIAFIRELGRRLGNN